jgi:sugar transferase (PEP-CTERM system associated)
MGGLLGAANWLFGAYDRWYLWHFRRNVPRLLFAFGIVVLAVSLMLGPERFSHDFTAASVASASLAAAAFCAVLAVRLGFRRLTVVATVVARAQRRILVVGAGPRAAAIERLAEEQRDYGFVPAGFVPAPNEHPAIRAGRILPADEPTVNLARRLGVAEIIVAVSDRRGLPLDSLLQCRLEGIAVRDYSTFWERETGKVLVENLDPSWLVYSDGFAIGQLGRFLKRQLDVVTSSLCLVFVLPLLLASAIAIWLDSPGPVLYMQTRVGHRGREFEIIKFRTMCVGAETAGVPQWAAAQDSRITRVGAVLRRLRIDELPQLLNVLKGDMSLVGPRPERPVFVKQLSAAIPYYSERHRVRPGITGWAQINYQYAASEEDAKEKLSYDLYYIKNYSVGLDLLVLLRTLQAVLWPVGVR